jgi:allophanate hydrolase-like protein
MTLLFLNGGGMRGGPLHHHLRGAPLLAALRTAPHYRFYAVHGRFPALSRVDTGGATIAGELYDIPLPVLGADLLPAEPPELELGAVELADGAWALATILRRDTDPTLLQDITHLADWRTYQAHHA